MKQVRNPDVILDTPFFNRVISAYGQASDVERMGELLLSACLTMSLLLP